MVSSENLKHMRGAKITTSVKCLEGKRRCREAAASQPFLRPPLKKKRKGQQAHDLACTQGLGRKKSCRIRVWRGAAPAGGQAVQTCGFLMQDCNHDLCGFPPSRLIQPPLESSLQTLK